MDEMRTAGVILAALELAPATPSGVTAILLNGPERRLLLGRESDGGATVGSASTASHRDVSPLARYLAGHIDQGRVEHWIKIVDRGWRARRYRPLPVTAIDYPRRLREERDAPPLLFYSLATADGSDLGASDPSALGSVLSAGPSLAIVGSREVSTQVMESTERVASDLAVEGVAVVSGLAAGVDAAAHRGALAAGG